MKVGKNPFAELIPYESETILGKPFIDKWVVPYYMELSRHDEEWFKQMEKIVPEITEEVILNNLGNSNWRNRAVGAYFVALKNRQEFIDIIGIHLIKSELTYAGRTYALVLASFNNDRGNEYLDIYLDYYLKQHNLYYDQAAVIAAIKYLDEVNGTNILNRHLAHWKEFVKDKQNWKEEINIDYFKQSIAVIGRIRNLPSKIK
jgi:hypothetical protein